MALVSNICSVAATPGNKGAEGVICAAIKDQHIKTTILPLPLHFATFPTSDGRRSVSFKAGIRHHFGSTRWGSLKC